MNPGPKDMSYPKINKVNPSNLIVLSYNIRGLKDQNKIIRFSNFLKTTNLKNNAVINIQETHLTQIEISRYKNLWGMNNIHSPAIGTSGGVSILYDNNYFDDILETKSFSNGRMCSLIASKGDDLYYFLNVYAPTNVNEKVSFIEEIEKEVYDTSERYPNILMFLSGDFNLVLNCEIDSINRTQTRPEMKASNILKEIMTKFNLIDTYRFINSYGGYTWGRNNPTYVRSRLDLILSSKSFKQNIISSTSISIPHESDHSIVYLELDINLIDFGPGIIRANSEILNDPEICNKIKNELRSELNNNIFNNPHSKLDYAKMILRNKILIEGKKLNRNVKTNHYFCNQEVERLTKALDHELSKHNIIKCKLHNNNCFKKIDALREGLEIAKVELEEHKALEAKKLIFRSRAKWAEKGEKSNKYFMNLLKERQRKMQIRKITSNGVTYIRQNEISKAISSFYKDLYSKQKTTPIDHNNDLFKNLPQINEKDKKELQKVITLTELTKTLKTCKESAPGPDGITYRTYEKTWDIMGPLILESWIHSSKIGITSTSQRHSIITLLEKKGKDPSKIENLRPISLSNCDIKLCTKTLAIRTNKVLDSLINITQTGYVPTRQVYDNSRLLEEIIEHYKKNDYTAYLITLDAQKAFDSVDHTYITNLLRCYNFPEEYISNIKTLYTGLNASVLVNGYCSEIFQIEQSVKQGDALSCALFILSIEPLLQVNPPKDRNSDNWEKSRDKRKLHHNE